MIALGVGVIGAVIGGITAYRRKGNRLDILHYSAGFGLAFLVAGLILTVLVHRQLVG